MDISKFRAFIHLDTVFTMVDYDKFTIPGSELSRGRGGPRCMSCPLNLHTKV